MIINLVGPPGSLKSTFASRFILEHPYFTLCDISGYRAEYSSEEIAWRILRMDVNTNKDVVLETCGLNHQLKGIFNKLKHRHVFTILMTGEVRELQRRVRDRQKKRKPPFEYRFSDELEMVEWVIEHMDETPISPDLVIESTSYPNDYYNRITDAIINERLKWWEKN